MSVNGILSGAAQVLPDIANPNPLREYLQQHHQRLCADLESTFMRINADQERVRSLEHQQRAVRKALDALDNAVEDAAVPQAKY